ncbi:MAG: hypothetical protein AAFV29_25275, partial [Myxococcota bacterium]
MDPNTFDARPQFNTSIMLFEDDFESGVLKDFWVPTSSTAVVEIADIPGRFQSTKSLKTSVLSEEFDAYISVDLSQQPLPPELWIRADVYLAGADTNFVNFLAISNYLTMDDAGHSNAPGEGIALGITTSNGTEMIWLEDNDERRVPQASDVPNEYWACIELHSYTSPDAPPLTEMYFDGALHNTTNKNVYFPGKTWVNFGIFGRFADKHKFVERTVYIDNI